MDRKDGPNNTGKMAQSGEKTARDIDEMTLSELRSALNDVELSTEESLAVLRNRLRNARDDGRKTGDAAGDGDDDTDNDPEDDDVDIDSLSKDELQTRRLGLKITGNKAVKSQVKRSVAAR